MNNIKLKSKLKFSLNKELKTQHESKEESKESIHVPFGQKLKKQIWRNHKNLRKIPSTNYIYQSSLNKMKLVTQTINYSSKDENDKKESIANNTFKEIQTSKMKSL